MININALLEQVKESGAKRVLVQLPEGLKTRSVEIIQALEKAGIEAILSADPCYGACDIKEEQARLLECDLIVHIGHTKFYDTVKKVLYYPISIPVNPSLEELKKLPNKLTLVSTAQHLEFLPEIAKQLESIGKSVNIHGQVLGCSNLSSDNVILFIGSGTFHPTNIKTKAFRYDIESEKIEEISTNKLEMKRQARIANARESNSFAILVSSKKGQFHPEAGEIKKKLELMGKQAIIIIMDEITPNKLEGIKTNAFINTACPRITEDLFHKPIINKDEINLLGE